MKPIVELSHVTFAYSNGVKVLNDFSLQIPRGSIYGFLGPNGSGKSTTIRIAMGLLGPQAGDVTLFGQRYQQSRISILSNIGSLIDSPTFYEHLSATKNLELIRLAHGLPQASVAEALELVGLSTTGKQKVSQFSLGMKQRLALAMAMMPKPELLVLDEPSNGLDPNGIIEIRELLIRINQQHGTTIFVSSHLLSEIEKLCTHISIINRGKTVFEGKVELLTERIAVEKRVWLTVDSIDKVEQLLKKSYQLQRNGSLKIGVEYNTDKDIALLNQLLVSHNVEVYGIQKEHQTLEEMYVKLFENTDNQQEHSFQKLSV